MNTLQNTGQSAQVDGHDTARNPAGEVPAPTVWPTLKAHDAHALIDFLVEKVGFRRTAVYSDGDEVAHAQLDWPEGGGVLLGSSGPENEEWFVRPGASGMYVVTDDVDGLYRKVKDNGVTVTRELSDREYGNRDFVMRDPEGNFWTFGHYRGDPAPR
jgi:uncharacterized glyoxalase superfamily protein PhnB